MSKLYKEELKIQRNTPYYQRMSTESEILAEIEALKAKIPETKALYREVCGLLFFRHGITPTTNKLYQFVRKGTMATPAEALAAFWEELRLRARVEIDHPDLPDEIKALAAEAIAGLWGHATAAARGELAASRLEHQAAAERAQQAQAEAEQATAQAQVVADHLRTELASSEERTRQALADLEAERRDHAGSKARVQQMQAQLDQARIQQQELQDSFSTELAKAREATEGAQERAAAAERRALMEIEQERQARAKAEKATEVAREKLALAEARERQQSLEHAEAVTRLQMEANTAKAALQATQEAQRGVEQQLGELRAQLADAQQAAARHQAEAQTLQGLVARLTPAGAPALARPARKKAGKADG